ncbi:ribosome silencing factor [Tepidamorphus sp. 3E244]|uniref:ribosome silencing factor n=1 Tax=Tepidamorphus sp. 3E244 TaxID=3385498 RepID=UPI0038FCC315
MWRSHCENGCGCAYETAYPHGQSGKPHLQQSPEAQWFAVSKETFALSKHTPGSVQDAAQEAAVAGISPQTGLLELVETALDDAKAEEINVINLTGKSAIADAMIVASGRSDRHVGAVADRVLRALKDNGHGNVPVEGQETCDWVLIDAGDVVVHIFRPEVRDFYNLEKMWSAPALEDAPTH